MTAGGLKTRAVCDADVYVINSLIFRYIDIGVPSIGGGSSSQVRNQASQG